MSNPFEFLREVRDMNDSLTERLDRIIERLDTLISVTRREDLYGDGK